MWHEENLSFLSFWLGDFQHSSVCHGRVSSARTQVLPECVVPEGLEPPNKPLPALKRWAFLYRAKGAAIERMESVSYSRLLNTE
jgi:hypothetical protein